MSDKKRRLTALLVLLPLGLCLVLSAHRVRMAVGEAHRDLLRADTETAAELLRQSQDREVLTRLFGSRWRWSDTKEPTLDEAVVEDTAEGPEGKAAVYDAESWDQVGTVYLRPPAHRRRPAWATGPWLVGASTLLGLALAAWLWVPGLRWRFSALCLALLGLAAALDLRVEKKRLEQATAERMALGVEALRALPDLEGVLRRPGGVFLLTGLRFILHDAAGELESSTLPPQATAELEAIPPPAQGRYRADHVEYAVSDVGRVRLVLLPYEHVCGSGPILGALCLIATALAALIAWLLALAARRRVLRRHVTALSFLAPSLLLLAVFTVGPLVFAAWLSLHRWSLLDTARPFVGLDNYVRLVGNAAWWRAIGHTAFYTLHVPIAMALALALALVVEPPRRGIVVLRTALFIPSITSLVAVAIAWQWMLNEEVGLINWVLSLVGIEPVAWLSSPRTALVAIMWLSVWMVVGYQIVLFQAGLAAIPQELYDAARIDGAGAWGRFVHVTLPGLRHTLFFVLVTSVIGSFQVFGAVYVMTEGGPLHATDVAVFHIYEEAWEFFRFGDAAAMSWVLFALIFFVSWLQFRVLERRLEAGS